MVGKIINFFRKKNTCNKSGIIGLKVEVTFDKDVSFRVDGDDMQVNWGDGTVSGHKQLTEQFVHEYQEEGVYDILITGNNITALEMPGCSCIGLEVGTIETLEFINCSNNRLQQLEVCGCDRLYELYCDNNRLQSLCLDGLSELYYLSCTGNCLEAISLKDCRNLVNLYCSQNKLRSLDLSHCRKLLIVKAGENAFDEIALLHFISTLEHKINNKTGLLGIHGILSANIEQIRISIAEKGWCEI